MTQRARNRDIPAFLTLMALAELSMIPPIIVITLARMLGMAVVGFDSEAKVLELRSLNLGSAQQVIAAALAAGAAHDRRIAVVVVDKFGDLLACARMDGLAGRYIKAALRKAYTAAVFERDTLGLMEWWKQNEALGHQGPHDWNDPMLTTLPGGFVVVHDDQVVGGIGCSGGANGTPGIEDGDFAETALAALGPEYRHRLDWS